MSLLAVVLSAAVARSEPSQVIIATNPTDTNAVLERLQKSPEVTDVRRVFNSQLLVVVTANPDAMEQGDLGTVYVNQTLDISTTGGRFLADSQTGPGQVTNSYKSTMPALAAQTSPPTDDPLNVFQWAYQNFGYNRTLGLNGTPGIDTGAHAVSGDGTGVTVAIVTSGADYTHEDLAGALWTNSLEIPGNGVDDDGNGYVDDVYGPGPFGTGDTLDRYGHGTALTGMIAAQRNNGIGITGIAPGAKVLACNAAIGVYEISVADLLRCVDYVIEQKTVHNENIPVFVFPVRGWAPFDQIIEPALRALMEADIVVIAPILILPIKYAPVDIDKTTDTPATVDFPNIISVSAIARSGGSVFKGYGFRTVDVKAPGAEILTTLPGYTPAETTSYAYEDFESVPPGWTLTGGWEHVADAGFGGSGALRLTSAIGDVNDDLQVVELPPMDLTQVPGPRPWFSFKLWSEIVLDEWAEGWLALEVQYTEGTWVEIDSNYERMLGPAWQHIVGTFEYNWLQHIDLANAHLRFHARLNAAHTPYIVIDDFGIGSEPVYPGYSNNYGYYNGTSAAAAIVGAMVAVIREERPELSNTEIRNLVAGSGLPIREIIGTFPRLTPLPPLPENRLAALWTSDGRGALQCSGLLTQRRTRPTFTDLTVRALGQPFLLRAISTDCGNPGQAPQVSPVVGPPFNLADDGQYPDQRAADAEFAGFWQSDEPVNDTLTVSNDEAPLPVLALRDYTFREVPFQWRHVDPPPPHMPRPRSPFDPPFEMLIGDLPAGTGIWRPVGTGFTPEFFPQAELTPLDDVSTIRGAPGTLSNGEYIKTVLGQFRIEPVFTASDMLFPYLVGIVDPIVQVSGESPNREWIFQWSDFAYRQCEADTINVQIVVFENSPDILVNYRDVPLDCEGKRPRLLVQYNIDSWVEYPGELAPATSILLIPDHTPNSAPTVAQAIPDQVVVHGEELALDISAFFTDPDGDELTYFLGKDQQYISVDESGILRAKFPTFPATEVPARVIEVGAHDGRLATRTSFAISFAPGQNTAPRQLAPVPAFEIPVSLIDLLDLRPYFDDPDLDPLEFIDLDNPGSTDRLLADGRIVTTALALANVGDEEIVNFAVSDGTLAFQSSARVVAVAEDIRPPVQLADIPDQTARVGEYLRVPLDQYFESPDGGVLSFEHISGWPTTGDYGIGSGAQAVWQAFMTEQDRLDGPYDIQIRVTTPGALGEVVTSFKLNILPENQAPAFTVDMPIEVTTGNPVTIDLGAIVVDPEGDPIYFVVGDPPPELQYTSETAMTGTLPAGQYSIALRATDNHGASLVDPITITVSDPAPPPPPPPGPPPPITSGGGGGGSGGTLDWWSLAGLMFFLAVAYCRERRRSAASRLSAPVRRQFFGG